MTPEEHLRSEAIYMLMGGKRWDGPLFASWLQDEFREHPIINMLAKLIDGSMKDGRMLVLKGQGKSLTPFEAADALDEAEKVGSWLQGLIDQGETYQSAIAAAEDEFGISEATADRRLRLYRVLREMDGE